jgi:Domain of unknown function (DUF1883)
MRMNYLHYELDLKGGDIVEVTLDKQANVRLLDEMNFSTYKQGGRHTYHGGLVKQSPIRLAPPHPGHWHLVIDLGGYAGTVQASVRTLRGAA